MSLLIVLLNCKVPEVHVVCCSLKGTAPPSYMYTTVFLKVTPFPKSMMTIIIFWRRKDSGDFLQLYARSPL